MKRLLYGEKVHLTALEVADVATITAWYRDSLFLRLYDATPAYPRAQSKLEKSFEERINSDDVYIFGIHPVNDTRLLGVVEIDGILWAHRVCWISIAIGEPSQRGRGYGTEAMQLALAFIFEELNLHRVQLTVFAYNTSAIAVYKKLGFTHEGTYRQFLQRDGERHDMLLFGLLRDEWAQKHASNS